MDSTAPLSLRKLRVFREVVERQSLTLAAQRLAISQPVISGHIRDLERVFGAKLLHQQARRMLPTEAGRVVYEYALQVVRATHEASALVRELASGAAGTVTVAANMTPGCYLLPPRLTEFKRRYPAANITLLIFDSTTLYEQTLQGTHDFAVVGYSEPPGDFVVEVLTYDEVALVVAPTHPLAGRSQLRPEELANQAFIGSPYAEHRPIVERWLREIGLREQPLAMSLRHPEAVKQAVRDQIGIGLLFRCSVERELQRGELVRLTLQRRAPVDPFYLFYNRGKRFSPLQQELLEHLRQSYAGAPLTR